MSTSRHRAHISAITASFLLILWLLAWGSAAAQSFPPLDGVVSDSTGTLNASEVNSAAAALQTLNVKPLAVFSSGLQGSSNIDDYAHAVARNYGLVSGDVSSPQVDANLFAIVTTTNPRLVTIVWGDRLNPVMADAPSGQGWGARIRTEYVQPALAEGNYTKAYTDGFTQAAKVIDLYRNPPTPTAVPTQVPSEITNIDTSGLGKSLVWIAGGVVLFIALLIIVPLVYRSYRRNQEAAARRQALQDQLAQARTVAADMITDLDFPADPREQLQYRFLALALSNERPDQLATITSQYNEMYRRVSDALARYNELNKSAPTTEQGIADSIAQYQYVQAEINNASAFLKHIADVSKQVEAQTSAAPGELDQAKKSLAAATSSLERLTAAAPDLYHPRPDAALKLIAAPTSAAQEALQAEPPLSLRAFDAAKYAQAQSSALTTAIESLAAAYALLPGLRTRLATLRKQGYKLPQADGQLSTLLDILSGAAHQLEAGDLPSAAATIAKAAAAVTQANAGLDASIALQKANEKALADLTAAGAQVKSYIDEGARVFDQVDDYAESSWQDIRGNGTEAQNAANHANALWEEATKLNSLDADAEQDFEQAQALIAEANEALADARQLIDTIVQRLANLQESQRTALAEITAAANDINMGQDFVRRYDRDITPRPADLLKEASDLLDQAKAVAALPKPDWIAVVTKARAANDNADRALAVARSQHEAVEARRLKLHTVAQQAEASVSRAANFVSVHRADIAQNVLDAANVAAARLKQAQALASRANNIKLEDVALSGALDEAIAAFVSAQQLADQTFNDATAQFTKMDNLRTQVSTSIRRATDKIQEASNFVGYHGEAVSKQTVSLLQRARKALPDVSGVANAAALKGYIASANEAQSLAEQAYNSARSENDLYEQQNRQVQDDSVAADVAANIGLAILGSLLSGAVSSRSSRRRGGWGGGGWGSSGGGGFFGGGGGSWGGGGGSSGGSFGGGGSSGGSFGGGGSSGGGWGGGGSSSGGW
ncbi:MAG: TPM domain-containing protein [Chloroflexota bacterium]